MVGEEAWWQQVEVAGAQAVERDGAGVQLAFSSPPFFIKSGTSAPGMVTHIFRVGPLSSASPLGIRCHRHPVSEHSRAQIFVKPINLTTEINDHSLEDL